MRLPNREKQKNTQKGREKGGEDSSNSINIYKLYKPRIDIQIFFNGLHVPSMLFPGVELDVPGGQEVRLDQR